MYLVYAMLSPSLRDVSLSACRSAARTVSIQTILQCEALLHVRSLSLSRIKEPFRYITLAIPTCKKQFY